MTDRKTISINPELFKVNNKTKKQKSIIPTISPSLKNKFLKKMSNTKNNRLKKKQTFIQDPLETNDFENSIQYLTNLIHEEKKDISHNRSIKQFNNIPVETELAIELKEEVIPDPIYNSPISLNYKVDNEVGYGCLKNGIKPSYRTWIKTKKVHPTEKEIPKQTSFSSLPESFQPNYDNKEQISLSGEIYPLEESDILPIAADSEFIPIEPTEPTEEIISVPKRQLMKNTIKKNYTLGKSTKYRKIGVLLKNKTIKQKVLDAQKELKKTNIKNIKKYLTTTGLIKIGSTAPVDVLKEIYENAKLTGDVTNSNKETLLHNFINDNVIE
jgi:hypothetical protein